MALPTHPNAVRLRVWRTLKALGCGALRDGAYVLPMEHASGLADVAAEVRAHGGTASVLTLQANDDAQRADIEALFDRTDAFAQWHETATALQAELPTLGETDARRRFRSVSDALQAVRRIDYYPTAASSQAEETLAHLRRALDNCFSHGEPSATAASAHGIPLLDRSAYQHRHWATRARPWVDRLASAWLIRRFIDPGAHFVWLAAVPASPSTEFVGFDYDGAPFTHAGPLVTFEVLMASFGVGEDARLQHLARTVRYLDAGGIPVPEAAGLEAVLAGLRELNADDDRLLQAAMVVLDALYAAPLPSAGTTAPATRPAAPRS